MSKDKKRDKREHWRRIEVALAQATQTLDDLEIPIPTGAEQAAIKRALIQLPLEAAKTLHSQAIMIGDMLSRTQEAATDLTGQLYGLLDVERKVLKLALKKAELVRIQPTPLEDQGQVAGWLRSIPFGKWPKTVKEAFQRLGGGKADQDVKEDNNGEK